MPDGSDGQAVHDDNLEENRLYLFTYLVHV